MVEKHQYLSNRPGQQSDNKENMVKKEKSHVLFRHHNMTRKEKTFKLDKDLKDNQALGTFEPLPKSVEGITHNKRKWCINNHVVEGIISLNLHQQDTKKNPRH